MYATAQNLLWQSMILETVKRPAKAIVQNVSVLTAQRPVEYIDGFLNQMKRGRK